MGLCPPVLKILDPLDTGRQGANVRGRLLGGENPFSNLFSS